MKRRFIAVISGLLVAYTATSTTQTVQVPDYSNDPRLLKLKDFFESVDSPAAGYAEQFLLAADRHGLDWRLLPSIAMLESGGGKAARNNNILGWDNGRSCFPSPSAGIHYVASRLAQSKLYRGKNLRKMLSRYNPHADYPRRVQRIMRRLAPEAGQILRY